MAEIIITEEMLQRAKSYMPIEVKDQLTRLAAKFCVESVESPRATKTMPLPNFCRENRKMRQQFSMGVLAQFYFGCEIEHQLVKADRDSEPEPLNFCMSTAEYNRWAQSHVLGQLERLKKSRNGDSGKVYDLLYDFKGFENMLFGAIRDELEQRNDLCGRMMEMAAMETTAAVKEAVGEIADELRGRLDEGKSDG